MITTNPVAIGRFLIDTAYILQRSQKLTLDGKVNPFRPGGQHHLCEEGTGDEHKIGVPHCFIASVSTEDEKIGGGCDELTAIRTSGM